MWLPKKRLFLIPRLWVGLSLNICSTVEDINLSIHHFHKVTFPFLSALKRLFWFWEPMAFWSFCFRVKFRSVSVLFQIGAPYLHQIRSLQYFFLIYPLHFWQLSNCFRIGLLKKISFMKCARILKEWDDSGHYSPALIYTIFQCLFKFFTELFKLIKLFWIQSFNKTKRFNMSTRLFHLVLQSNTRQSSFHAFASHRFVKLDFW